MHRITRILVAAAVVAIALGATLALRHSQQAPARPQVPAADLVLRGGRIVTVDDRVPEGQALAAAGGKVVAVGSNADIAPYVGPNTQVIELNGQLAIPGFIEGHG